MNTKVTRTAILFMALVLIISLFGCGGQQPTPASTQAPTEPPAAADTVAPTDMPVPPQPIKIGVIAPTTGDMGFLGDLIKQLIEFVQTDVNGKGGINGQPVTILLEDDGGTSAGAVTAAQKLITVDKVDALVGPLFTSSIIAVKPIATEANVPVMIATSADPQIFAENGYVFSLDVGNEVSVNLLSDYLFNAKGFKKLAILGEYNDQTLSMIDIFNQDWTDKGGTVVSSATFNPGTDDFRTTLTQIKQQNPDVIWIKSNTQELQTIIRQMTELGMNEVFIATDYQAIQNDFYTNVGTVVDGRLAYTQNGVATDPETMAKYTEFSDAYSKAYGAAPEAFISLLYDDFGLLFQAMQTGATSGPDLRSALASIKQFTGVTGFITFDSTGRSSGSSTILEYKDGETSVVAHN